MIWKIIGTLGALSFIVTGFTVLGDANCITADIGGGRVVGVTCRADSYGTWSGSSAGMIMCLIGIALLTLIYWRNISALFGLGQQTVYRNPSIDTKPELQINYSKIPSNSTLKQEEDSILAEDLTQIKICDKCKTEVHLFYPKCFYCQGTTFTFKKAKRKKQTSTVSSEEVIISNPEFKTCPMCAEDIKFAAKKCRYCQHMMDLQA